MNAADPEGARSEAEARPGCARRGTAMPARVGARG